ncbi:MAG: methyltransferase domain-containing protein [Deltaproteobacteria bacterium]|nr:methyltransferase domain-containing protein [Deltaproteobacteria bacterium]
MSFRENIKAFIPESILNVLRAIRNRLVKKHRAELAFFTRELKVLHGTFRNHHFERIMPAMAGESGDDFIEGKIVADFGCGPRGSLRWASKARLRIGIDVLADRFAEEFFENFVSHGMVYLTSTERVIPLPSNCVDILFTLNAMDHVDSFPDMCGEIIRVIKPGGEFIGSFNLEEFPTPTEPQRLSVRMIHEHLLDRLEVRSYRISGYGAGSCSPGFNRYAPFFDGTTIPYEPGQRGVLWVRARKPAS